MRRLSNGNWEFYINGTLRATNTTNLPTGNVDACFQVKTTTAATRALDVDHFSYRSIIFTQRY